MKGYNDNIQANYTLIVKKQSELKSEIINQYNLTNETLRKFYLDSPRHEDEKNTIIFNSGTETNMVVINITNGKIQLIDGFLRVLYSESCNKDIVVKVYEDLTDEQFLHELVLCNIWKESCDYYSGVNFFDRGFLFALQFRFGIDIQYVQENILTNMLNLLSHYSKEKDPYLTIVNNKFFTSDVKTMFNLATTSNIGTSSTITETLGNKTQYTYYYSSLLCRIFKLIGEIRTYFPAECQKDYTTDMFISEILKHDKELKSISKLTVNGRVDNRINDLMVEIIQNTIETLIPIEKCTDKLLIARELTIVHALRYHECSYFIGLARVNQFEKSHTKAAIYLYREFLKKVFFDSGLKNIVNKNDRFDKLKVLLENIENFLSANNELDKDTLNSLNRLKTGDVGIRINF